MKKLTIKNSNHYLINAQKVFEGKSINKEILEDGFEFAESMVFGEGHHRGHRSGGQYNRKKGELFANTFQGKLAEFVIYNELINIGFNDLQMPDTAVYGKGVWDDSDLEYKGKKINIKSTAFFSNLLLLEKKDWNEEGEYIPNIGTSSSQTYDFFLMVRIKPDIKGILKRKRFLYSNDIDIHQLRELILEDNWAYDFAGYCNNVMIKDAIKNGHLLPQNALLNARIPMDADNYYIQVGNLKDFESFVSELKTL